MALEQNIDHAVPGFEEYPTSLNGKFVDVCSLWADERNKWLCEPGPHYLAKDATKILVVTMPCVSGRDQIERNFFTDGSKFLDFIHNHHESSESSILILIKTEDNVFDLKRREQLRSSKPSVDIPTLRKLCMEYELHPMLIDGIGNVPNFQHQLVRSNASKAIWTHDIGYCCSMDWIDYSEDIRPYANECFSIPVYFRANQEGKPMFTMYLNVPHEWVEGIVESWIQTQLNTNTRGQPVILDHLTLLSRGLNELNSAVDVEEYKVVTFGDVRLWEHARNPKAQFTSSLNDTRNFLDKINIWLTNLISVEIALKNLQSLEIGEVTGGTEVSDDDFLRKQMKLWNKTLLDQVSLIRSRLLRLSHRTERTQSDIVNVIAVRDNNLLNGFMKTLVDTNNNINNLLEGVNLSNSQDFLLKKYLAEIIMVSLPLTAVSTFFGMKNFSFNSSLSGTPPFRLRHIWIFGIAASAAWVSTWSLWFRRWRDIQKRRHQFYELQQFREEMSVAKIEADIENENELAESARIRRRELEEEYYRDKQGDTNTGQEDDSDSTQDAQEKKRKRDERFTALCELFASEVALGA